MQLMVEVTQYTDTSTAIYNLKVLYVNCLYIQISHNIKGQFGNFKTWATCCVWEGFMGQKNPMNAMTP